MQNITRLAVVAALVAASPLAAQDPLAGVDPDDEVIHLDTTDERRDPWSQLGIPTATPSASPGSSRSAGWAGPGCGASSGCRLR